MSIPHRGIICVLGDLREVRPDGFTDGKTQERFQDMFMVDGTKEECVTMLKEAIALIKDKYGNGTSNKSTV